jgi:23S rRNA (adenine1618-N6)-methyltransferase
MSAAYGTWAGLLLDILLFYSCAASTMRVAKPGFHPRNLHRFGYDFERYVEICPELKTYVAPNNYGTPSIDFSNPKAVKCLNLALLKNYYNIQYWEIPADYLTPPIPSRADYVHHVKDLLEEWGDRQEGVVGLDLGTGANCIYPIIGAAQYGWKFVGTEVDAVAVEAATNIVQGNEHMKDRVEIRLQSQKSRIMEGVVGNNCVFDFAMVNPPFHSSLAAATRGSERKWRNLNNREALGARGKKSKPAPRLNFGGATNELIFPGGEVGFISTMIKESSNPFIRERVKMFTTLVSSQENLPVIYRLLQEANVADVRTIDLAIGNKKSRIVAWKY